MTGGNATRESLDSEQYTTDSIIRYETVYGQDFISPGGAAMARELICELELPAKARVLDVGCGLGGSTFMMAREFGYRVDGIDLSDNMVKMATARLCQYGLQDAVRIEAGDAVNLSRPGQYDAVYSRDVFLHIHEKPRLFTNLFNLLKPGGKLLFTDYGCGEKPWDAGFEAYVNERGYCLHTVSGYQQLVEDAGFEKVQTDDITPRFVDCLQSELSGILSLSLPPKELNHLQESWQHKIDRALQGDHRWIKVTAIRPPIQG